MTLTAAISFYFVTAAVLGVMSRRASRLAGPIAVLPFLVHVGAVLFENAARSDRSVAVLDWIPSLGVSLTVRVDPLSLILSAMIGLIGLLIVIYSVRYVGRSVGFLALMTLFTGGMAGVVVSDNLFVLFLFWEITTVASYLLIGFEDESASARSAALQAILVTTLGGLAMLAGFVLLSSTTGTASLAALTIAPPTGTPTTVALVLILLGAFTKSAQVPFHFWLPGAMAAPTPASAYLHSATMVKAGIVLLLLVEPVFPTSGLWTPVVATTGLVTMVFGAVAALGQRDLKLLLAYGTISQLGLMTALIGLRLTSIALAVMLAHAAFKAALFLVVGAIDKATGTRDLQRLGGLGRAMPLVAITAGVASLSMAGLPPLIGFVTKESAFDLLIDTGTWIPLGVISAASVLTVAYTARFWFGAFAGSLRDASVTPRATPPALWLPPAILAALSLVLGVFPAPIGDAVSEAIQPLKLVLWPGWKPALAVSAAVVIAGTAAYLGLKRLEARSSLPHIARFSATRAYSSTIRGLNRSANVVTGVLQNGSLPVYLAVILTTVLTIPTVIWVVSWEGTPSLPIANSPVEAVLGVLIAATAIAAARVDRRLAAALLLGGVGYAVSGIYVAFRAPDLALTQILAETLTIALFAFVLAKLPRRFGHDPRSLSRRVRLGVSGLVGAAVTVAAVLTTTVDPQRAVSDEYIARSIDAGGRNVVNVILTNFRALDTLGEITVLAIAAAGVSALVLGGRTRSSREREDVAS